MTQPANPPTRRLPLRRLIGLLVVAALVIAGIIYWPQLLQFGRTTVAQLQPTAAPASGAIPAEAAAPRTAPVTVLTVETTVNAAGAVSAVQSGAVAWKTSGNVAQVNVQAGDHIRAGQPLLTLDPLSVPQAVILAQGDVVSTQRALDDLMQPPTLTIASAQQNLAKAQDALTSAQKAVLVWATTTPIDDAWGSCSSADRSTF